jgi:hypothetical protein
MSWPRPDRKLNMQAGQLPIDEQLTQFRAALRRNRTLMEVLARAVAMNLPGWYLVAGCLYQTVWNVVTGQPPEAGILDYDLAYFDGSDLSWDAEDVIIKAGSQVFAGLPAPVQIRNQARVHLWYEQKFGVPCRPHASTEAAIDTFEATTACLGVRLQSGGRWRIYAPHGLGDVFNLVSRPTRCSPPATSTRPRPRDGASNGQASPSCPGRNDRSAGHTWDETRSLRPHMAIVAGRRPGPT